MRQRVTLIDYDDLTEVWAQNGPPAYIVLAAANGWKPKKDQDDDARFDDIMRLLGGSG